MLTIVLVIVVTSSIIIITNAVLYNWGIVEILIGVGTTLAVVGGIGVYTSFAGGTSISSAKMHAMSPEMAHAEKEYAFKRRQATPIISILLLLAGIILLAIFLPRIWR